MMTKKKKFLEGFDNPENNSVIVYIGMPDLPSNETIINPKKNFESKKSYYEKAYNDDLELKANTNIKIVDYSFLK